MLSVYLWIRTLIILIYDMKNGSKNLRFQVLV